MMRHKAGLIEDVAALRREQPYLPDVYTTPPVIRQGPASLEEFQRAMEVAKREGHSFLKILGGVDEAQLRSIIEAAHGAGLKTAGHVPRGVSVDEALSAGLDGIEHNGGYTALWPDLRKLLSAVRRSAEVEVFNCPTLDWYDIHSPPSSAGEFGISIEALSSRPGVEFLPKEVVKRWTSELTDYRAELPPTEQSQPSPRRLVTTFLATAGAPLLASAGDGAFIVPGFGLLKELTALEDSGVSRYETLRSATVGLARFFEEEDQRGTVEVGKRADLLLLRENPLQSLKAVHAIEAVVKDGRLLDRGDLEGLLESVAAWSPMPG